VTISIETFGIEFFGVGTFLGMGIFNIEAFFNLDF